jgi:hypothetical protein
MAIVVVHSLYIVYEPITPEDNCAVWSVEFDSFNLSLLEKSILLTLIYKALCCMS